MALPRCVFDPGFLLQALISIQAFGLICSAGSNSVYDGRLAFVPALEDVLVWDVKRGQQVSPFSFVCITVLNGTTTRWLCGMKQAIEQK